MFLILRAAHRKGILMELIKIADLLVDKIKTSYKDDIAIVALCGSYIYNDMHQKSDLDFYFIPKTERGYEMSQCFILEDIGFDFWGMSWSRAESLAKYDEENTSIITKAEVIYYASQEDLDKFNALRNMKSVISKKDFLQKAIKQAEKCQNIYFEMLEVQDNFSLVKQNAIRILYFSAFSTALINQKCIERGGRHLLNEVLAMELYPKDFDNLFMKIIHSSSIDEMVIASQTVILNLRNLIRSQNESHKSSIAQGWYVELKSIYNKLLYECETDNQQGIALAIARLDHDVFHAMNGADYSHIKFPDLFTIRKEQCNEELIRAVKKHEKILASILALEEVPVINYRNLSELRNHLNLKM